ncbi:MAG: hypothetical protein ACOYN0_20225 [Phycisphaerales bacterium]
MNGTDPAASNAGGSAEVQRWTPGRDSAEPHRRTQAADSPIAAATTFAAYSAYLDAKKREARAATDAKPAEQK